MTMLENQVAGRRNLLKNAGIGAAAIGALSLSAPRPASAQTDIDADILNFALNLEYLEAEFYLQAVYGHGLSDADSEGVGGPPGAVSRAGSGKVPFTDKHVLNYAKEIANDELNHVRFLRSALGSAAVARPAINLSSSFNRLAVAAGIANPDGMFSPFTNQAHFLLGAFIFEDVGVTAYNGAAAAITNPDYLTAAASILAVEAYHAGAIRLLLLQAGPTLPKDADAISALRGMLSAAVASGAADDQGVTIGNKTNIVPTDANSLAFARTTAEVLNIVYGGGADNKYLFFPNKMNGAIS